MKLVDMQISKTSQIWLFTVAVGGFAIVVAQLSLACVYFFGGIEAINLANMIVLCCITPFMIAAPVSYLTAYGNRRLVMTQKELQHLAQTDPLTRLPNRRQFFAAVEETMQRCAETGQPCAMLVLDADYFKDLNDTYGHIIGDQALIGIAEVLRENSRSTDLISRVGGEEFAVLLLDSSAFGAETYAKRIVEAISNNPLVHENSVIEYSVSCGVADNLSNPSPILLFKAADDAMYLAKERGRNRVQLSIAA